MYRLRVFYEKKGISKFISHKNLCKIIERALRRIDFPFKFSEGYSPHTRISFASPLPVNIIGLNEVFEVYTIKKIEIQEFLEKVNLLLPEGIKFLKAEWVENLSSLNDLIETAIYKIKKEQNLEIERIRSLGKVIEENIDFIKIEIPIKNFNHKNFLGYKEIERTLIL